MVMLDRFFHHKSPQWREDRTFKLAVLEMMKGSIGNPTSTF